MRADGRTTLSNLGMSGLSQSHQSTQAIEGTKLLQQIHLASVARQLGLSNREREIIRGFFLQETEMAAALRLGLSPHTVHTYVQRIHRKLGSADRCSAVIRVFMAYLAVTGVPVDPNEQS